MLLLVAEVCVNGSGDMTDLTWVCYDLQFSVFVSFLVAFVP